MQKLPHFTNMLLQTSGCAHITYSTHTIRKSYLGDRFIRIQTSCNKELKKGSTANFWHYFHRVWSISKVLSGILFLIDTVCLMTVKWPKPYDKKKQKLDEGWTGLKVIIIQTLHLRNGSFIYLESREKKKDSRNLFFGGFFFLYQLSPD